MESEERNQRLVCSLSVRFWDRSFPHLGSTASRSGPTLIPSTALSIGAAPASPNFFLSCSGFVLLSCLIFIALLFCLPSHSKSSQQLVRLSRHVIHHRRRRMEGADANSAETEAGPTGNEKADCP